MRTARSPRETDSGSRRAFLTKGGLGLGALAFTAGREGLASAHAPEPYETTPELSADPGQAGQNVIDLQAALDSAGVIYIKPGSWPLNGDVVVRSNSLLRGVSLLGTLLRFNGGGLVVGDTTAGFESVAIENLTIHGANTGIRFVTDGPIAEHCVIRDVVISGSIGSSIHLLAGTATVRHVHLQDLHLADSGTHGLVVDGAESVVVQGISIDRFGEALAGEGPGVDEHYGMWLRGACQISQVDIVNTGPSDWAFFFDEGSDRSMASGWRIRSRTPGREFKLASPTPDVRFGIGNSENMSAPWSMVFEDQALGTPGTPLENRSPVLGEDWVRLSGSSAGRGMSIGPSGTIHSDGDVGPANGNQAWYACDATREDHRIRIEPGHDWGTGARPELLRAHVRVDPTDDQNCLIGLFNDATGNLEILARVAGESPRLLASKPLVGGAASDQRALTFSAESDFITLEVSPDGDPGVIEERLTHWLTGNDREKLGAFSVHYSVGMSSLHADVTVGNVKAYSR